MDHGRGLNVLTPLPALASSAQRRNRRRYRSSPGTVSVSTTSIHPSLSPKEHQVSRTWPSSFATALMLMFCATNRQPKNVTQPSPAHRRSYIVSIAVQAVVVEAVVQAVEAVQAVETIVETGQFVDVVEAVVDVVQATSAQAVQSVEAVQRAESSEGVDTSDTREGNQLALSKGHSSGERAEEENGGGLHRDGWVGYENGRS